MAKNLRNDPDRIRDATDSVRVPQHGRPPYSATAEQVVRDELSRIAMALDTGDRAGARAVMEAMPQVARAAEGRHLLSLVPPRIRQYVDPELLVRSVEAYADGDMGFIPDLAKISFEMTARKRLLLRKGFRSGALNGCVVTAYPSAADLPRLVDAVDEQERRRERAFAGTFVYQPRVFTVESLRALPVTEFLLRHFEARGGVVLQDDRMRRIWAGLRWPRDGEQLSEKYGRIGAENGWPSEAWFGEVESNGERHEVLTLEFRRLHALVHDGLSPQATLGDVLGTVEIAFTNIAPQSESGPVLTYEGEPVRGENASFARLLERRVQLMNPTQFFALTNLIATPGDPATYPSPGDRTFEWLGAIDAATAAGGLGTPDGLIFSSDDPVDGEYRTVRSAVS